MERGKSSMKAEADPRDLAVFHDILESVRFIRKYTNGLGKEAFLDNTLVQDAVCLRLAVIGELAGKFDKPVKGLPLKSMKALRNRIAHEYGRVDLNIVWKVVQDELDPIAVKLEDLLKTGNVPS
jgi:uncharacterized protein with HEPN domain